MEGGWKLYLFNTCAVIAALVLGILPPVVMLYALNDYAVKHAQTALDKTAKSLVEQADVVLNEGMDALAKVAPRIRFGCTEEMRGQLNDMVAQSYLRHVAATDASGAITCGTTLLKGLKYAQAFRPAKFKSVGVALGTDPNFVQLRWQEGANTIYGAIFPDAMRIDAVPAEWRNTARGTLSLDDGVVINTLPRQQAGKFAYEDTAERVLTTTQSSQRFPIRLTLKVPQAIAVSAYEPITTIIKVGTGLLGIIIMVMVAQALRRKPQVQDALARGIKNSEFVPYYQPVMNIETGALMGCEVLIRWRKPDGTMVPPGAFIQQAEESGLAIEMTRQLMRKARDELGPCYAPRGDLKMAFNLFADHFSDLSTVEDVREIFKTGGIRYSQLVLEVTERYPLPNINRALVAIAALQELGCRVALDDAGTGHGGLAYLQTLGMDQVKIDKLFVDTIQQGTTSSPIVDSLIELARHMNMEVVAEGVETVAQLDYLRAHGVQAAQGYLFAEPMSGTAYRQLVESMCPLAGQKNNVVYLDVA